MSFTDNLMVFNTQIEEAIAAIPQEDVLNDPNIYRLVKLLSWSKLASGTTGGGGGGGGTPPTDIASGINASDIPTALTDLFNTQYNVDTTTLAELIAINSKVSTLAKQDEIITALADLLAKTKSKAANSSTISVVDSNLTASQSLYAANPSGLGHVIFNNTGVPIYVNLTNTVASIAAGGFSYVLSNGQAITDSYGGAATVIADSGATGYITVTTLQEA